MIELSEEWLNKVARRASAEEETWTVVRPTWLDLEDEPSAIVNESRHEVEATKHGPVAREVPVKHDRV